MTDTMDRNKVVRLLNACSHVCAAAAEMVLCGKPAEVLLGEADELLSWVMDQGVEYLTGVETDQEVNLGQEVG